MCCGGATPGLLSDHLLHKSALGGFLGGNSVLTISLCSMLDGVGEDEERGN